METQCQRWKFTKITVFSNPRPQPQERWRTFLHRFQRSSISVMLLVFVLCVSSSFSDKEGSTFISNTLPYQQFQPNIWCINCHHNQDDAAFCRDYLSMLLMAMIARWTMLQKTVEAASCFNTKEKKRKIVKYVFVLNLICWQSILRVIFFSYCSSLIKL